MERKMWAWAGAAVLALVLVPGLASAQGIQTGQLAGEVKDRTGGALPGANVTMTSVERGFSRMTVTDGQGKFLFTVVPIGRYTVNVKMPSFQELNVADNLVEAERTTNLALTLSVSGVTEGITVTGQAPIVDAKNQTIETRVRADEFQKLAVGRSYQTLLGMAPGIIGTGNVNAHGSLSSNNIFMFDGVNTTDPTTGGFAANINFEAIQEMVVRTGAVGVEYGRGTGAVVDVITKSGTNRFEGSFKFIMSNDNWNPQNKARNEITNAVLERTKFDSVNKRYAATLGGPIRENRAWFFGTYEYAKLASPAEQTNADDSRGFTAEEFVEESKSPWYAFRLTTQLAPNHNVFVKYATNPTTGFINDYWGASAERRALTGQDQKGDNVAVQYSGVLGSKWTLQAMAARSTNRIDVFPFETEGAILNGAPIWDLNDNRFYNGATFDGFVDRPRQQASAAMEYFTRLGGNDHQVKFGIDWQRMESTSSFRYPSDRLYYMFGFNPQTRDLCAFATTGPNCAEQFLYDEYDPEPSISKGKQTAFYLRDRFTLGPRVTIEGGVRMEKQTGTSDIGAGTVDTWSFSPRLSGSYALTPDARTILVGSAGRFHDGILQGFSDAFASVPQQTNRDIFIFNTGTNVYDFLLRDTAAESNFRPDLGISPRHMDEVTFGVQHQLNNQLGVGGRFIWRKWGSFIDDVMFFNEDGTDNRTVANVDEASRDYRGFELTLDKRFGNNWAAMASYTWSRSRGNHFADAFTGLRDFEDATCGQQADAGLGTATLDPDTGETWFLFPCSEVQSRLDGTPTFDRPHMLKFSGSYRRPIGAFDVTAGFVGMALSSASYSKSRTVSVLSPDTFEQFQTLTYFYDGRGSDRVSGLTFVGDLALEGVYRAFGRSEVGVKFETFNLFNNEDKINTNNTNWCNSDASAACQQALSSFGKATTRAQFNAPRTYRVSFLIRF
jgi:hypothetical protein